MDAWTVRKSLRKLHSWWKTNKEEPDKIESYQGGQRQNMKKKEITHIKMKKEERRKRKGTHKIQREKHIEW